VYSAGWLHCASSAPDWQVHGWICGPENTGPPFGWFTTGALASPLGVCAVSRLDPSARPVTRAMKRPSPSTPDTTVAGEPLFSSTTDEGGVAGGSTTSIKTSPPLIRSARFESTSIAGAPRPAPGSAAKSSARVVTRAGCLGMPDDRCRILHGASAIPGSSLRTR